MDSPDLDVNPGRPGCRVARRIFSLGLDEIAFRTLVAGWTRCYRWVTVEQGYVSIHQYHEQGRVSCGQSGSIASPLELRPRTTAKPARASHGDHGVQVTNLSFIPQNEFIMVVRFADLRT